MNQNISMVIASLCSRAEGMARCSVLVIERDLDRTIAESVSTESIYERTFDTAV